MRKLDIKRPGFKLNKGAIVHQARPIAWEFINVDRLAQLAIEGTDEKPEQPKENEHDQKRN